MKFKDIALIYGGELVGKGTDMVIDATIPQYGQATKLGLAAVLPLITAFKKFKPKYEKLETVLLLVGAYLSTTV